MISRLEERGGGSWVVQMLIVRARYNEMGHTLTQVKVDIFSLSVRWSPVLQDPTTQRSTLSKWWVLNVILLTWQKESDRERGREGEKGRWLQSFLWSLLKVGASLAFSLFKFLVLLTCTFLKQLLLPELVCCVCVCAACIVISSSVHSSCLLTFCELTSVYPSKEREGMDPVWLVASCVQWSVWWPSSLILKGRSMLDCGLASYE